MSSQDTWCWSFAYTTVHSILQTILDTIEETFQLVDDKPSSTTETDWEAVDRYLDENNCSPYEDRGGEYAPEWPMDIDTHLSSYDGSLDI